MYSGEEYFTMHSKSGYKAKKNYKKTSKILQNVKNALLLRCIQGFWIHSALKNEYILKEA